MIRPMWSPELGTSSTLHYKAKGGYGTPIVQPGTTSRWTRETGTPLQIVVNEGVDFPILLLEKFRTVAVINTDIEVDKAAEGTLLEGVSQEVLCRHKIGKLGSSNRTTGNCAGSVADRLVFGGYNEVLQDPHVMPNGFQIDDIEHTAACPAQNQVAVGGIAIEVKYDFVAVAWVRHPPSQEIGTLEKLDFARVLLEVEGLK